MTADGSVPAPQQSGDLPGIVVFSTSSRAILYADAVAADIFAMSSDELLAHDIDDLVEEFADLTPRRFTVELGGAAVGVTLEELARSAFVRSPAMIALFAPVLSPLPAAAEPPPAVPAAPVVPAIPAAMWSLVVDGDPHAPEFVSAVLREGINELAADGAFLVRCDGDAAVAEASAGEQVRDPGAIASLVDAREVRLGPATAVGDVAAARSIAPLRGGDPTIAAFVVRTYEIRGQLRLVAFTSRRPREWSADDLRAVDAVARTLAYAGRVQRDAADAQVLAYSDELTGLPNRAALFMRLDETIAAAERYGHSCAVLFLDIDGFKSVNDTAGHAAGDIVLREMARRLRRTLRREEFIGRLGGDEFAILLPQIENRSEIDRVTGRISAAVAEPVSAGTEVFPLSASIGVAIYPADGTTRDALLNCADAAMYAAKAEGRARVHFTEPAREFNAIVGDRRRGRLDPPELGYLLVYQPVVSLDDRRTLGVEALVRRVDPLHGLLSPERVLAGIPNTAARQALDRWVVREAAIQARAWDLAGKSLQVAVNLAAFDPRSIEMLLSDEAHLIDYSSLAFEVDAAALTADEEGAAILGNACRMRRISLIVDGFDGGAKAAAALSGLPIDAIKLGRDVVERALVSRTAQAVVQGTALVAHSLNWRVVAKGVESLAQRKLLASLGCDAVQGFAVAYPMTAPDISSWLNVRSASPAC